MSKFVLVGNGVITDVANTVADKFEIKESAEMFWIEAPVEVVNDGLWSYDGTDFIKESIEIDSKLRAEMARKNAYGLIGEQLDMMYKDKLNGTTTWEEHVANVKSTIVGPSSFTN